MRILPIAAVLTVLGSNAVGQTDAPKGYIGAYRADAPDRAFVARAKIRPVRDAWAQVRCEKGARTYWTEQMPGGAVVNLW
jgi:hypothetical protein